MKNKLKPNFEDIGWNFDNTYSRLSEILISNTYPTPVKKPELLILNHKLCKFLNLNLFKQNQKYLSSLFSGNILPKGSNCISQAYAGHQFGHLTILGDGRAILIGEHINKQKKRFDIQFKGSGITKFSRNGDGRAELKSMLREYLISEAMHGLKIPTTRSLAVTLTGEKVFREKISSGAILTRVADSHIRIGTFQYLVIKNDIKTLKKLINYTLNRHYLEFPKKENNAITLLKGLIEKQISLVINWMRVGFIHGVINTDNVSLAGETIDYGPCAFMDYYDPNTVYSSIDHQGRYSFGNQEIITHWNISRFAETLIPFLADTEKNAIDLGTKIIDDFPQKFKSEWIKMMKNKLGFIGNHPEDEGFIKRLLFWMKENKADYTNTFLIFMEYENLKSEIYKSISFLNIYKEWKRRIKKNNNIDKNYKDLMKENNPTVIPRNHIIENALDQATKEDDYTQFNKLINILEKPYENKDNINLYQFPPSIDYSKKYKTFCGT